MEFFVVHSDVLYCSVYLQWLSIMLCVLVVIKEEIDFESVAACVGDGVKAYTALHHLARLEAGETVLILDAATGFGSLTVQLALAWAAKVNRLHFNLLRQLP